jgi:pentatricopeptide repeat protein
MLKFQKKINLNLINFFDFLRCLKPVSSGVAHAHNLIVDCLIRQGMYTQAAENMWSQMTEKLNDCNHIFLAAKLSLEAFLQSYQNREFLKSFLIDSCNTLVLPNSIKISKFTFNLR